MILNEDIAAVKSSVNMRQLAQAYGLRVNRAGYAICPFHHDKHPSMQIFDGYLHKDGYICRSCGAGGTIFNFVMEYDSVDFEAALRKIAAMFNIPISNPGKELPPEAKTDGRIRILLADVDRNIEAGNRAAMATLSEKIRWYEQLLEASEPLGEMFRLLANEIPKLQGEWECRFELQQKAK